MRVIAGLFKGRRLGTPSWKGLRPTSDKLRETLFNIVSSRVPGARVLDCFAGTGALGIEALSRGAEHTTFIEREHLAIALIRENLQRCGIREGYEIVFDSFLDSLTSQLIANDFDLIFLDPPYEMEGLDRVLGIASGRLAQGGLLILEHSKRSLVPESVGDIRQIRRISSGDSALDFYQRIGELV